MLLGRLTHHIHPEIVSAIAKANLEYESHFAKICSEKLDQRAFFYRNSDCVFPGFRRPVNSEKTRQWKNNVNKSDGTILNDNTFPRHVWAYLSTGRGYAGGAAGMWEPSGLGNFELAHIFSHKSEEREVELQAFDELDSDTPPYGMFTSASNVVLIPKGFAKPTDAMANIKACFYQRHIELYGNNVCGATGFKPSIVPSWYTDIVWLQPLLPADWEERVNRLLTHREQYLARKYRAQQEKQAGTE
jgi:hypothetical protein